MREVEQTLIHVRDGAIILEESEAKYWACQLFGNNECFFIVPVPYFELEDDCLGWCFDVAICGLKFEGGGSTSLTTSLEDIWKILLSVSEMQLTRAPESMRASRVKSWKSIGANSIFFFFLSVTAEKIGMQCLLVPGSLVRYSPIWAVG